LTLTDLLILDDFGMAPLSPSACRDFLEVIDDRHDKKSIAISAQLRWQNGMPSLRMLLSRMLYWIG